MLELLAITIWDPLDYLLIDMPPGIGDEIFDVLRYLRDPEFLVITTPSRLVRQVVERLLEMLSELKVPMVGLVENMVRQGSDDNAVRLAADYGTTLLGTIPFVPGIDEILMRAARGGPLPANLESSIHSIASRFASIEA
jgi:ATP-binding protein involved in chromosome partitioning